MTYLLILACFTIVLLAAVAVVTLWALVTVLRDARADRSALLNRLLADNPFDAMLLEQQVERDRVLGRRREDTATRDVEHAHPEGL